MGESVYPARIAYRTEVAINIEGRLIMNSQNIKEDIKSKFNQSLYVITELLLDIALIESLKIIKIDQERVKKITASYWFIFN